MGNAAAQPVQLQASTEHNAAPCNAMESTPVNLDSKFITDLKISSTLALDLDWTRVTQLDANDLIQLDSTLDWKQLYST